MNAEKIYETVRQLKAKYDCSDIFSLCRELHILLLFTPMGSTHDSCKGFFLTKCRIKCITVNSELPEHIQRIVAAHELGHAMLHTEEAKISAFHDFDIFDRASVLEYEANVFAAELLMSDDEILELLNDDISFFDVAKRLFVPPELLDFKFRIMKRRGYKINPPMIAQSNFLKKL